MNDEEKERRRMRRTIDLEEEMVQRGVEPDEDQSPPRLADDPGACACAAC